MSLVLADTSVWVAHFRKPNPVLQTLLTADRVLCHPMVLIEIACGTPPAPRERTLSDLRQLRSATVVDTDETLALIEREQLQDSGCGAIDVLLLGSTLLTSGAALWTLDKDLRALAERFDVSFG
jgi:predicted nucleic acid-binding protein